MIAVDPLWECKQPECKWTYLGHGDVWSEAHIYSHTNQFLFRALENLRPGDIEIPKSPATRYEVMALLDAVRRSPIPLW